MRLSIVYLLMLFWVSSFSQEKDLQFFIEKAQSNSPLIKDLSNQIKLNSLDSLLNKALYKPQVTGNLNANLAPTLNNGFGYDSAVTNGQTLSGLIGVSKKIIGKNQINSQSESFKLVKDALVLNKKVALKDVTKLIISQYVTASGSAQQIVYNKKMAALLQEEAAVLKKLTQNSIYKQTDYLIFLSTVKQQELLILQLHQQYQNDLALLNYLSGETDTTFVALKKPDLSIKSSAKSDELVFFKQFEVDSLKIKNQNKLIDNAYKPSLSLLSDAGYLSSFTSQGYKNFGFSIGLGLSIPIYDGKQRMLLHQKNQTSLNTSLEYKHYFKKQYDQQLLMLDLKLKQANVIENQLKSQLQIAEALIEADKKLLLTGDAQITEFVLAISNIINLNNSISQNTIAKLQVINEINYWKSNEYY